MGLGRIILERDFLAVYRRLVPDRWSGRWTEFDLEKLSVKLYDPKAYSGGIIKLTIAEYRALPELNRRVRERNSQALMYDFLAWVDGRGLYRLKKAA